MITLENEIKRISIPSIEEENIYCNTEFDLKINCDSARLIDLHSNRESKSVKMRLTKKNYDKVEREVQRKRKISMGEFLLDSTIMPRRCVSLPTKRERFKYIKHIGLNKGAKSMMTPNMNLIPLNRGFGSYLEANKKHRPYMEDYVKLIDNFNMTKMFRDKSLFVVCDGHAGDDVAKIVVERLPDILYDQLRSYGADYAKGDERAKIEDAIMQSFKKMDDELINYEEIGCTCNIIFMQYEKNQRVIYSANVGDSRSVLIRKKEAIRLSYDHKAIDKGEIDRVKKEGGIFLKKRFYGALAITRAFGDYTFKIEGAGLSNIPYITRTELSKEDYYIIMGSDGVWDVINEEKAYFLLSENADLTQCPNEVAKLFVTKSCEFGSKDNICCIAIKLN